MCRRDRFLALVLLALLAERVAAQPGAAGGDYVIGAKDTIKVQVLEDDSLNTEVRVSDRGTVEILHVGEVEVAGRTAAGAAAAVSKALERYLQRATVTVQVVDIRSQPIRIIGAVQKEGRLPFSARWTLLEALTEVGGLTKEAGDTIVIRRVASNGLSDELRVPIRDLLGAMDPSVDIPLFPNDLINVQKAYTITVYCNGEVATRGPQEFRSTERITLITAISKAGGLTDNASGRVIVVRDGDRQSFEYSKILRGEGADFELEDGDVLIAKESFF